ncbi:MAG: hypothetical protein QOH57_5003 [Mycobacterium sp.]|nr:hypothetical protein [Mycobacterium sp.]
MDKRRPVKLIAGLIALAMTACALLARYLPFANRLVLTLAAFLPVSTGAGVISVILLGLARRPVLAGTAAAVTAAAIATQVPLYFGDDAPASAGGLRVLTVNLKQGEADPDSLVQLAKSGLDVLAVQELSFDALHRLDSSGLNSILKYRIVEPRADAYGIGLWSRFAITDTKALTDYRIAWQAARIQVAANSISPVIAVAYLRNPILNIDAWSTGIRSMPTTLRQLDEWARGGPVVIAGDFNSTLDMRPFRDALQHGYRDAAAQTGAGWQPTFESGRWFMPSLIAIDHVLTLRCEASGTHTVTVPGTDHRALATTIAIAPV